MTVGGTVVEKRLQMLRERALGDEVEDFDQPRARHDLGKYRRKAPRSAS